MEKTLVAAAMALMLAPSARADDSLSRQEAEKIVAALSAIGCVPGEMERDDDGYEVDDAKCADGEYEIELNNNFEIIKKQRD